MATAARGPRPGRPTRRRRDPAGHPLAASLLAMIGLAVALVILLAAWSLAAEFATVDMLVLGLLPWALVPAVLLSVAAELVRPRSAAVPGPWWVLAGVWLVVVVLACALALLSPVRATSIGSLTGAGLGTTSSSMR